MFKFLKFFVFAFAVVIAVANAECNYVDVLVSSSDELVQAFKNVKPGWNIILKKGNYSSAPNYYFKFTSSGTSDCPITITCKNPGEAILSSPLYLYQSSYVNVSNIAVIPNVDNDRCMSAENLKFVTIQNVQFSECLELGLFLYSVKNVTVSNCSFNDIGDYSIHFYDTQNSVVKGCTFGDDLSYHRLSSMVIWMRGSSSYNLITDNKFQGRKGGFDHWIELSLCSCYYNEFSNNVFDRLDGRVIDNGIVCYGSGLTNNTFKDNYMVIKPKGRPYPDGVGFRVYDTKQRVCASNKVYGVVNISDGPIDPSC